MIEKLDIELAASILSKYYKNAKERKNEKALKEVKQIMTVYQKLVDITKQHNEIED